MSVVFMIVFFLIALMIVGLVLLQEGKGGGLTGMSTGMDGVMGAKNPLRRMTAYLFVFFVLMCLGINWYFHDSGTTALPEGMSLPAMEFPAPEAVLPVPPATETPAAVTTPEAAVEAVEAAVPATPASAPETPAASAPEATPPAETPAE